MTAAEQASLEALRTEVSDGFRELRDLMETRRLEEVRVQTQLDLRIAKVESARTVADAFFSFGKYVISTVVASGVLAVVIFR